MKLPMLFTKDGRLAIAKNPVFQFFASIRFAIPVMIALVIAMIAGTVIESRSGTEFARIAVYHSFWFYGIQAAIALSLTLAMLNRIPLRKRLLGFYLVHIALLILMGGAVVTRYFGVDGTIELHPNEETSAIKFDEDRVSLRFNGEEKSLNLAPAIREQVVDARLELGAGHIATVVKYLPYAQPERQWVSNDGAWISTWTLKNQRMEEEIELSNLRGSQIPDRVEIGALRIEVMAHEEARALFEALRDPRTKFILKNVRSGVTVVLPSLEKTLRGKIGASAFAMTRVENPRIQLTTFELATDEGVFKFFPRFSAAPVSNHMTADESAPYRFVSLESYRNGSSIILFRDASGACHVIYGKGDQWAETAYRGAIVLPWMDLRLQLKSEHLNQAPIETFVEAKPSKEAERNLKAALVRISGDGKTEEAWLIDRDAVAFTKFGISGKIAKRSETLPFAMTLEKFKMDRVPGMETPASYESFVRVKGMNETVHIYMNHPFKAEGFTFYQSSYFQDERGAYHSVLSVNKDPGRAIKYLGSILLVIGLVIHFMIIYGYIFVAKPARAREAGQ